MGFTSGVTKTANPLESNGGLCNGGLSENPVVEQDSAPFTPLRPPTRESGGLTAPEGRIAACLQVIKAGGDPSGLYTAEEIRLARLCGDGK